MRDPLERRHLADKSPPLSIVLEIGAVQEPAPLGAFFGSSADGPLHLGVAGSVLNALLGGVRRKSYRFHSAPIERMRPPAKRPACFPTPRAAMLEALRKLHAAPLAEEIEGRK